jgi:hypothetical protein
MVDSGNAMSPGVEVTRDAVSPIETGLESLTGCLGVRPANTPFR